MKRIETKRKKPKKPFRRLFARTGARRQRAHAADARDYPSEVPNQSIGQVLLILLILHVVAIAGIYIHSNFIGGQDLPASTPSPLVSLESTETEVTRPSVQEQMNRSAKPIAPAPPKEDENFKIHHVRSGDTYALIAQEYKVPQSKLREANKESALTPGSFIKVPKIKAKVLRPAAPRAVVVGPLDSGQTYKIVPGDSLSRIAREHHTSIQALMELNGIENPNKIRVGQKLKLPQ